MVAISLILFFCDYHFHCFDALRSQLLSVTTSIQYVVNLPLNLARTFSVNFVSKQSVLEENARLHAELQLVNAKLQRLDFLEHENSQLRGLLNLSQRTKSQLLGAQILISAVDNYGQQITIDKGKQQGVYLGQPVLDIYGLFGQVIEVGDGVSKVMLLTNNKSAIPVMITRNWLQTVVVGAGHSNYLELLNIPETADIKAGDSLVTSGLGQRFPAGYKVGVVKEIKRGVGERFMKVSVTPDAHLDSGLFVILVWPDVVEHKR